MSTSPGYKDLQPNYILGTDKMTTAVARQMVGSEIKLPNQLEEHFPFYPVSEGKKIIIPRVKNLGTSTFIEDTTNKPDISQSTLQDPPEIIDITGIVGDSLLTNYAKNLLSGSINQQELHIQFKTISAKILFWSQFFRPKMKNGFLGLPDLVSKDQILSAGDLTLEALDDLVMKVSEAHSEMDRKVIIMNSETFKTFVRLVRAAGGDLTYAIKAGRRYAVHNGVPILVSDYIPFEKSKSKSRKTSTTTIWCCTLGYEDNGIFGLYPASKGNNGMIIEKVTGSTDTDSDVQRVRWYTAITLSQTRGLSALTDVSI